MSLADGRWLLWIRCVSGVYMFVRITSTHAHIEHKNKPPTRPLPPRLAVTVGGSTSDEVGEEDEEELEASCDALLLLRRRGGGGGMSSLFWLLFCVCVGRRGVGIHIHIYVEGRQV